MKIKQLLIITILNILLFSTSNAQSSIDLLTVGGRYGFSQQPGNPESGRSTEFGGIVKFKVPVEITENTMWYSLLTHIFSYVESKAVLSNDVANPIRTHATIFQTGIIQKLNDKQKLLLFITPRFMSDGLNITADNIQMGGMGLFENRFSDKLMMRFGALFNVEEFGPTLTPLIHVDWKVSDKLEIVGTLPINLKVNYQINKNLIAGFSHFVLVTSYRQGNVAHQNNYIERTSIDLTLFARIRLIKNLHLEARAGYGLSRKYEQFGSDQNVDFRFILWDFGPERILKNQMMDGGFIANLRFVYNLPI